MEQRVVMSSDTPNAFTQAKLNRKHGQAQAIMKIAEKHCTHTKDLWCWRKWKESDSPEHAESNPWNVGKRIATAQKVQRRFGTDWFHIQCTQHMHGKQECKGENTHCEIHVDDSMSSHADKKVNDKFLVWLNEQCGKHGEVKATKGNEHDCLGMTFRFGDGKVKIDVIE